MIPNTQETVTLCCVLRNRTVVLADFATEKRTPKYALRSREGEPANGGENDLTGLSQSTLSQSTNVTTNELPNHNSRSGTTPIMQTDNIVSLATTP